MGKNKKTGKSKVNQEKKTDNKKEGDYRIVDLEKYNTIVIVPNDTEDIAYFPLDLTNFKFSTQKFQERNFQKIDKNHLEKDLAKIGEIVQKSRVFDDRVFTFELMFIILFFVLAAYNNLFTFSTKEINIIEIVPTVVVGVSLALFMLGKAIRFFILKEKIYSKGRSFEEMKAQVDSLVSGMNSQRYNDLKYELTTNKNMGFVKLKKLQNPK